MKGRALAVPILVGVALAGPAQSEPALRTCTTAQLTFWVTRTGVAAGTVGGYLAFTNRGRAECTLHGWPTLTALRPRTRATAVHVHATMFGPYLGGTGPYVRVAPTVRLRHGQTAVAAFTTGDNPPPSQTACPPSYRWLRVIPPGNARGTLIKAWIAYYGHGLPSCGRIDVSMVVPASYMPPRG